MSFPLHPWECLGNLFQGSLFQVRPPVEPQRNPPLCRWSVLENSWELCPFLPQEYFTSGINNILLSPQNCFCLFWKILLASLTSESPMAKPTFFLQNQIPDHSFVFTSFKSTTIVYSFSLCVFVIEMSCQGYEEQTWVSEASATSVVCMVHSSSDSQGSEF